MSSSITDVASGWTKDTIKTLRLRLGWSQADLARRLNCASTEVDQWETGGMIPSPSYLNELFLIAKQADACSHEVHFLPLVESMCDQQDLSQIEFSQLKEEIE